MLFVLLVVAAFAYPAFTMRDPGPTLTPYGRAMAVADSLARIDSLPKDSLWQKNR